MELLIVVTVFVTITAGVLALLQWQEAAKLATQARLERIAMRSDFFDVLPEAALRANRMSSIAWMQPLLVNLHFARSLELTLIRAAWKMRVSEFLATCGLSLGVGYFIGYVVLGHLSFALLLGAFGAYVPYFILRRAAKRRIGTIEKQLGEMLVMMANALKAGFGLMQAVDQCARQLPSPIADELRQLRRDTQIGSSVEEAFIQMNERIGSYDLDIVVTAILVQRNVGGNLSEILDGVAHTMRERLRIRGEIATLTAQQRLTGYIIAALPPVLALLFFILNPSYMSVLITESYGRMQLGDALVLEAIGAWTIKRIIAIEV